MRTRGLIAAVALVAVLALAGCSGWLPHRRQGTAADPQALALAWSTPASQPDWLPADATRIRWAAETRGGADATPAAVRASSSRALPATCTPLATPERAVLTTSWMPPRAATGVRRCGNWAVAVVDGGYYGWTPVRTTATG